jgi:sulfite reductase beta subunit-like hemoprotein
MVADSAPVYANRPSQEQLSQEMETGGQRCVVYKAIAEVKQCHHVAFYVKVAFNVSICHARLVEAKPQGTFVAGYQAKDGRLISQAEYLAIRQLQLTGRSRIRLTGGAIAVVINRCLLSQEHSV